ncbi:MAG: AAA family ATPase [Candidatus Stahlbacteria bacterium]|nr:MAG: AAA family ATPase [Candidatus Stahlbacteria bacterium]
MKTHVKGQEMVKKLLSSMITKRTIPPALLFYGPPGVGKFSLALDFAGEIIGNKKKIERGVHPDTLTIFPDFEDYKYNEIFKMRKSGEYYKLRYSKSIISIDTIREIQNYAYLTPMESTWKMIIIIQAENMNINAADAFLKVLEEPPKNVLFILITPNQHLLSETIISRTLTIRFHPLLPELQQQIIKDLNIKHFGRGIEETLLLREIKDLEEELEKLFFNTPSKERIKNWSEDLENKWRIEFLLLYLWKMLEYKYKNGEIKKDNAYKTFLHLKKAYEYYYANVTAEKILFYLFLKI